MHEVLVNRLGGLSLPKKSVVRLTDRLDMTLDVYRGRKTTIQQLLCQPYSDCAYTQTSLHICDLRMPYYWFYHDTTQNGRNRDKCV